MTVMVASLGDVGKTQHVGQVTFRSPSLRQGATAKDIVTEYLRSVKPVAGVVTIDLVPGPAVMSFGGREYEFIVPAAPTVAPFEVPIWPLVEASVPYEPPIVGAAQAAAAEAVAARDDAAEILEQVSAGAVPNAAVAAAVQTGATKAALDGSYAPVSRAAKNPEEIAVGAITRSASGAATAFGVVWDDGATGQFTGTESTTTPGAIDSYVVTHVLAGVTITYTQPALTRDASGAVTARPGITVS